MSDRRSSLRYSMSAVLALSLICVSAAATDKAVEVTTASAPAGTDARLKQALSEAIRIQVGQSGLATKLRGYSILPALLQLRRVTGPGQQQPSTECVVELSLQHAKRGLVANVRGNASSIGATQLETLYAAAHSAVDRLPETLSALRDR
jgi:hypothetical protein